MRTNQVTKVLSAFLMLSIVLVACKKEQAPSTKSTIDETTAVKKLKAQSTSSAYYLKAQETHNFVYGNLLTTYNSYKVNTTTQTTTAYEWYNVSQIYADAAMVKIGNTAYAPYMNNAFAWMNNMWDGTSPTGGYFAAANVNGSGAAGDKYTDDNALSGVAYLDAYDVTTRVQRKQII
jgi:hypothetical protein